MLARLLWSKVFYSRLWITSISWLMTFQFFVSFQFLRVFYGLLRNLSRFLLNQSTFTYFSNFSTTTQEMNGSTVAASENGTNEHQPNIDIDVPMLIPFGPVPVRGGEVEPVSPVSNLISIFSIDRAKQVNFWKFLQISMKPQTKKLMLKNILKCRIMI